MIAHLLLMGAAGVQMGTIFAMAEESPAHPAFKDGSQGPGPRGLRHPAVQLRAAGGGGARHEEQG